MQVKKYFTKENILRVVFCILIIGTAFILGRVSTNRRAGEMGETIESLGILLDSQTTRIADLNRELSKSGTEIDELTKRNEDNTREIERLTKQNEIALGELDKLREGLSIDIDGIRELKEGIRAYIEQAQDD